MAELPLIGGNSCLVVYITTDRLVSIATPYWSDFVNVKMGVCSIEPNESNSVVVPQTVLFFMLLMWHMHVSLLEDAGCN